MNSVVVTSDRIDNKKNKTMHVYVECPGIYPLIDKYFSDNIMFLKVVSKAWRSVKMTATKIVISKLSEHFGLPARDIKWSNYCGCSCGCSPGYIVKVPEGDPKSGHSLWVKVDVTEAEIASVQKAIEDSKAKLAMDKEKNNLLLKKNAGIPIPLRNVSV
jgi:hypothetical protein